jgi:hypothetical protein
VLNSLAIGLQGKKVKPCWWNDSASYDTTKKSWVTNTGVEKDKQLLDCVPRRRTIRLVCVPAAFLETKLRVSFILTRGFIRTFLYQ